MTSKDPTQLLADYCNKLAKAVIAILPSLLDSVAQLVYLLDAARCNNHHVYTMGNGGSSATASHFASDLSKGASNKTKPKFKAHCLADITPALTAWANDTEYSNIFAGQLEGIVEEEDIAIAISVGGNSPNVVEGIKKAKELGAVTVVMVGAGGGELASIADIVIRVPDTDTERVEDLHSMVCHSVTYCLRNMT